MRERWNLIDFFSPSSSPKSGNIYLPPTVVMSTSAVRCTLRRDVARLVSARRFHTEPRPLNTSEDWADFQLERASYKSLGEYVTAICAVFAHP